MSQRAERREAERQARKIAYQELRQQRTTGAAAEPASKIPTTPAAVASQAQLTANRANAQLSTGPTTPNGKFVSSRNALKTGLTGRTVLLPTDNTSEYQHRLDAALHHHRPAGQDERTLVKSIVDIDWRLDRVVAIETGIYSKGLSEFTEKFKDEPPATRNQLARTETYLKYEKSLRNLNVQEARLQRQRTKNLAELKRVKEERGRQEILPKAGQTTSGPARVSENGFEFSIQEFTSTVNTAAAILASETPVQLAPEAAEAN